MIRLSALLVLGTVGLMFSPAPASAQFMMGRPNPGFGGPVPIIVPSFNPFSYVPQYRYQSGFSLNVPTMFGNTSLSSRSYYYGVNPPGWSLAPAYPSFYMQGSYASGGGSVRPNLALEAQRDLARAQRAMAAPGAYGSSTSSGTEKSVAPAALVESGAGGPALPDGFGKALAPAERARVLSGVALNELLQEIVKAEPKVGNRSSAFVPSMLLDDVRFGGSDAADALNLARRADNLDFPVVFDDPALKDLRVALARDFIAVASALQAGKSPDQAKRVQLEATLQKVETAIAPVSKSLPFEDATAARRFLNQMSNAVKAMKAGAGNGLIDPKWAAEGTTTADLVKHMTRHKLLFAPAPDGNEEAYTTMHRNLATYLFVLTQPKK